MPTKKYGLGMLRERTPLFVENSFSKGDRSFSYSNI